MKFIFKLIIVGLCFLMNAGELAYAQSTTRKVLFLGNSYTYTNNLPQLIADLAASTGDSLIFDSNTPGGYTLSQHFANSVSLNKIMAGNWDYVVLQEQSQLPALFEYVSSGGIHLSDLIETHNPCARKLFFMTWGRKNGDAFNCPTWPPVCTYEGMDSLLRLRYLEMASMNQAEVSPVGAIWNYIRQHHPSIELYDPDGSHPSAAGSFAAACSFYASVFRKDPSISNFNFSLNPSDAALIRNAAKLIVYDSLVFWDFEEPFPVAGFNYSIGAGLNEAIFNNTSVNSESYLWDFGDGNTSTNKNPVHSYAANGNYLITLTATNCDIDHNNQSVYQSSINFCNHSPTVFPDSLQICPNTSDTLWTQNYDSYQWHDEYGSPIPGATNQYFLPAGWKFYSVNATSSGCTEMSPQVYVEGFSTGLVIFYLDSSASFPIYDTVCTGDSILLILNYNKPRGPDNIPQWFENGVAIPNANGDTFVISTSGSYEVNVFNTFCPGYAVYTSPVSIFTFKNCSSEIIHIPFRQVIAYPNPFQGKIHFRISAQLIGSRFNIINPLGKIIYSDNFKSESETVLIPRLPAGIYFFEMADGVRNGLKLIAY